MVGPNFCSILYRLTLQNKIILSPNGFKPRLKPFSTYILDWLVLIERWIYFITELLRSEQLALTGEIHLSLKKFGVVNYNAFKWKELELWHLWSGNVIIETTRLIEGTFAHRGKTNRKFPKQYRAYYKYHYENEKHGTEISIQMSQFGGCFQNNTCRFFLRFFKL